MLNCSGKFFFLSIKEKKVGEVIRLREEKKGKRLQSSWLMFTLGIPEKSK